ncbi:bifunctional oligoribonuclease/PAP phosphatase NrnA [bacterium]|nr:bifunctional oligoribonuclease/PAP phosphatase NrnA [bacterium]
MQFRTLFDFLHQRCPLLLTTHVHPDGDAICSLLAFDSLCRRLNRESVPVIMDPIPEQLSFLPGIERIQSAAQRPHRQKYDAAVILDAGTKVRIGSIEENLAPGAKIANIDHHVSNDEFGDIHLIHLDASATCQIIFEIFTDFGITPTPEEATCLYTGILTDTGRFRFSNTTPRALQIMSRLADLGADPAEITERIYYEIPLSDLNAMYRALMSLDMYADGQVITIFMTPENQVQESDRLADIALSVQGVEVVMLFSEMPDERIRISFRSKHRVNVSKIAERFGGGGHYKAAGLRMRGTMQNARDRLLPVVLQAVGASEFNPASV